MDELQHTITTGVMRLVVYDIFIAHFPRLEHTISKICKLLDDFFMYVRLLVCGLTCNGGVGVGGRGWGEGGLLCTQNPVQWSSVETSFQKLYIFITLFYLFACLFI